MDWYPLWNSLRIAALVPLGCRPAAKNFKIICAVRGAKSATLFDISFGRDIPFCPVSCRRMRHELSTATGGKPACLVANFFRRICGGVEIA